MSKQIKKLEKETILWKQKFEQSNTALINLTEEVIARSSNGSRPRPANYYSGLTFFIALETQTGHRAARRSAEG